MLDAATQEILKGGFGYALAVAAFCIAAFFWTRIQTLQDTCTSDAKEAAEELKKINDERLDETKVAIVALERNTLALQNRAEAVEKLTIAFNDLTKGFAALVLSQESGREHFRELGKRLESRQEVSLSRQETVLNLLNMLSSGRPYDRGRDAPPSA